MDPVISGYGDASVDLAYIEGNETVGQEERDLLVAAQSNGNTLLETIDFNPVLNSAPAKISPSEVVFFSSPKQVLEKRKQQLVRAILERTADFIPDKFSGLYLDQLAHIIAVHSEGIVDMPAFVSRFVESLKSVEPMHFQTLGVWSLAVLNLIRLDILHDRWIADGGSPIIENSEGGSEGNGVSDFVRDSIDHLIHGRIKILPTTAEMEETMSAAYDSETNTLFFGRELFLNPAQSLSPHESVFSIVIHEMWHSRQDDLRLSKSLAEQEIEAEVLAAKVNWLLYGEDAYQEHGILSSMRDVDMVLAASRFARMQTPMKILAFAELDPDGIMSRNADFRLACSQYAYEEMTGESYGADENVVTKNDLVSMYFQYRMYQTFISYVHQIDAQLAPTLDDIESREFKRLVRKGHRMFRRGDLYELPLNSVEDFDNDELKRMDMFLQLSAMALFQIYYRDGEVAAAEYYHNVIYPRMFDQVFPETQDLVSVEVNGIPRQDEPQIQVMTLEEFEAMFGVSLGISED